MNNSFLRKANLLILIGLITVSSAFAQKSPTVKINFNQDWKFSKVNPATSSDADLVKTNYNDAQWEIVSLPHTANIEPLVVNNQWQGICWYRKSFEVSAS
ncbi:MAG: glycoside hydrolase family 2 protein, partial [Flavobacterium sp.]